MNRRNFVKQTSCVAIGMGVFGSINWENGKYAGDTITTTDILGPFYRPNAPFRTNLNPSDFSGEALHLSGTVIKSDGKTLMSNCLIEIWQCDNNGLYDNISDNFLYRGSQKTSKEGAYHFITAIPVPEPVDEKLTVFRPSHIHMRISADGQQDLITQIYFEGDPYLATDPSIKSQLSINRILTVKKNRNKKSEIRFDISLKKEYLPEGNVYHKIAGIYKMDDGTKMEFYRDGDLLFYKINNQIWGGLAYSGNNTFGSKENDTEARFELQTKGGAKVWFRFSRRKETRLEGTKVFMYNDKPAKGER
jgi:catechol 1,2-dioxygenase